MRHPRRGWPVWILAAALVAACQQTVHLFETVPDAAAGGKGGIVSGGGGGGAKGGGTGGKADAGPADGHCSSSAPVFFGDTPQMVIALDRSTSMNLSFPTTPGNSDTTHLSAAFHALYSNVGLYYSSGGSTFEPRPAIGFWFLDFPDSGTGCVGPPDCCAKDAVRTTSLTAFQAATSCEMPPNACVSSANRPTSAALAVAEQALGSFTTPGSPRYVLLLTDGDPKGTCSSDECSAALKEAHTLNSDNIHLLVVGIGITDPGSSNCLFDIANAANGNTSPPYLAPAPTPNDVSITVGNAMSAALCNGTVANPNGPVANPPAALSGIRVGNTPYSATETDEWTYDPGSGRLHLRGTACQNYVQGGSVQVYADCAPSHGGPGFP